MVHCTSDWMVDGCFDSIPGLGVEISREKFSLIRVFLGKLGLSKEAVDDVVDLIGDFLGSKDEKPKTPIEFPYHLRDNFLSNAEISFYHVVRTVVGESVSGFQQGLAGGHLLRQIQ